MAQQENKVNILNDVKDGSSNNREKSGRKRMVNSQRIMWELKKSSCYIVDEGGRRIDCVVLNFVFFRFGFACAIAAA